MKTATQRESTANGAQLEHRPSAADSRGASRDGGLDPVQATYDALLWRLRARHADEQAMVVGLMPCDPQAGATTIAANLALRAAAQPHSRVLLVDAHWNAPSLPTILGLGSGLGVGPGLFDILSGEMSPREWEPISVAANLDLLPCGQNDANYAQPVRRQMVEETLAELRSQYGLVIVDLPPVDQLNNSLAVARQLDGAVLVACCDSLTQHRARRLSQLLDEDGVNVWGAVMNRHREYVPAWLRRWL